MRYFSDHSFVHDGGVGRRMGVSGHFEHLGEYPSGPGDAERGGAPRERYTERFKPAP